MAKKTELSRDIATSIAHVIGTSLFEKKSSYSAKDDAQRNLSGKTHYVDEGTLKSFYSRISSARYTDEGLLFSIIESVAGDYQNKSRGFRFVTFDLYGTIVNDRVSADVNRLHSSAAKAEREMWEFLNSFDALAHYKTTMSEHAAVIKAQAANLVKLANTIKV